MGIEATVTHLLQHIISALLTFAGRLVIRGLADNLLILKSFLGTFARYTRESLVQSLLFLAPSSNISAGSCELERGLFHTEQI